MFDAMPDPEDEDDYDPENVRAVISIVLTYDGVLDLSLAMDRGDEILIADQLRTIADDIVREHAPTRRH